MADDQQETPGAAQVEPEAAPAAKKGWLRNIATDTFHEVDDMAAVMTAYPGQYENAKNPGANSKRIGWPAANSGE